MTDLDSPRRTGTLAALRDRNFRLIFFGQSLSVVGDGAYVTVLAWFTFSLTSSAAAVATVLGVVTVCKLVMLLVGGALADRYDRKKLMITSDLVRGVALTVLTVAAFYDVRSVALLVVLAAVVGLFDSLFNPAFMGVVPSVVDKSMLVSANALIGFVRSSRGIAGPAIGGALYAALGPEAVFGLNAATFYVAAALVALARIRGAAPSGARRNTFADIAEGARYVVKMPLLAFSIPVAGIAMMLADAPTQTLLPKLVQEQFAGGAGTLGAFETCIGVGMAVGAILSARLAAVGRRSVIVFSSWAGAHLVTAVLVWFGWAPAAAALFFVKGLLTGLGIALWETLLMELVPADKLSRVFSVDTFGSSGMLPIGFALAGLVGPYAPAAVLIGIGQGVAALLMFSLLAVRAIRTVR